MTYAERLLKAFDEAQADVDWVEKHGDVHDAAVLYERRRAAAKAYQRYCKEKDQ